MISIVLTLVITSFKGSPSKKKTRSAGMPHEQSRVFVVIIYESDIILVV